MARTGASGARLNGTVNTISDNAASGPWTLVTWFRPANLTDSSRYILQERTSASAQIAIIWEYVNNTVEFFASTYSGSNPRTGSGLVISDTSWHHIGYRKDASGTSSYNKFLDGSKTEISSGISFTFGPAAALTLLGSNSGNYVVGDMAFTAAWSVALSDAAITALAAGAHPLLFSPQSLLYCFDLAGATGGEVDRFGQSLSQTGTVGTAESPLVSMGGVWPANYTPAAVGATTGILRNLTRAIERGHSGVAAAQLGGVLA